MGCNKIGHVHLHTKGDQTVCFVGSIVAIESVNCIKLTSAALQCSPELQWMLTSAVHRVERERVWVLMSENGPPIFCFPSSHFHFRYGGHFPLSSSSQRTVVIFPPFIFVDLSAVIWEIRDRSQLSLSARSQLDLSLSASLVEISGSSPATLFSRRSSSLASALPLSSKSLSRYCQQLNLCSHSQLFMKEEWNTDFYITAN